MDELMWIIILKKLKGIREELQEHGKKAHTSCWTIILFVDFFRNEHLCKYENSKEKEKEKKKKQRWLLEYIENNGSSRTSDGLFFPNKTRQ